MAKKILSHRELMVYQKAFVAAMAVFELSKKFPKEETFSLKDQIRRSSRAVCTNLAEAWHKRRYEKVFVNKVTDAEAEAAETQVWLSFAASCSYASNQESESLQQEYGEILRMLQSMSGRPEVWIISQADRSLREELEEYDELSQDYD